MEAARSKFSSRILNALNWHELELCNVDDNDLVLRLR